MVVVHCVIVVTTEDDVRKYNNKHPLRTKIGQGVWEVMKISTTKAIGSIKTRELEYLLIGGKSCK